MCNNCDVALKIERLLMNVTQGLSKIKKWIALYIGAVSLILVPLYIKGSYFGLIELKARVFLYTAIPAVLPAAVLAAAEFFFDRGSRHKIVKTSTVLLLIIGLWSLFSSFMSENPIQSLTGSRGWKVGSLMTVVLISATIIVSRHFQFSSYLLLPIIAVNLFINTLAVIQSAGVNAFGLQNGLIREQYYVYLTTIGNSNSYSGYLCLLLPLFWGTFLSCKERATELLYGLFAVLGFMGLIMAESDSSYAGIGICLLFILLFVFGSEQYAEQYLKRSAILLVLFGGCLLFVRYFPLFEAKRAEFAGLSWRMLCSPVPEILILCGVLLYLSAGRLIRSGKGRYLLIVLETLIIVAICGFFVILVSNFNDGWGNGRGEIWRISWEYFCELPPRYKITGLGPEMVFLAFREHLAETGSNVVTAHSDIMQVLLTQGIVGLALYIALWGYLAALFFRKKVWKSNTAVFFFPLAAYWGQSLFCTVYPVTAVAFSFMAGLYLRYTEYADSGGNQL